MARAIAASGHHPILFEANQGQSDTEVKFIARNGGATLFLTATEAVFMWSIGGTGRLPTEAPLDPRVSGRAGAAQAPARVTVRQRWVGANSHPHVVGMDPIAGTSHYFIGNDPRQWHTNVPLFNKVHYQEVYPGIDVDYYGAQGRLEYDIVVAPHADPTPIRLGFEGARALTINDEGRLSVDTVASVLVQDRPVAYQEVNGIRRRVRSAFEIHSPDQVGIAVGPYDPALPLVIDPTLGYSSYLGGNATDAGRHVAVDSVGNIVLTGVTFSTDFPTANPFQPNNRGNGDAFVAKLDPSGALLYSTYLGGLGYDDAVGVAVDSEGNAYVTGFTNSTDFPLMNPLQRTPTSTFVAKLNSNGSVLTYATYLGGSGRDFASAITVDSVGRAYVAGGTESTDFPTVNAIQPALRGATNAFVAALNPSGSSLFYATYLGGSGQEWVSGVAVDPAGNTYVSGGTSSRDFPGVNPTEPPCRVEGQYTMYVAKLGPGGSPLGYSYVGAGPDCVGLWSSALAVDSTGNVYVTGQAYHYDSGSYRLSVFVEKLEPDGASFSYSTYLPAYPTNVRPDGATSATGVAVDLAGHVYVTGHTMTTGFPTVNAVQASYAGNQDAFLTELDTTGQIVFSTYFGGSGEETDPSVAVDSTGNVLLTGRTTSLNFPTTENARQPLHAPDGGGYDAFVVRIVR